MSIYEYEVKTIRGESQTLEPYKGEVMLIVNTATKCGFAPQFDGLEKLHQTYLAYAYSSYSFLRHMWEIRVVDAKAPGIPQRPWYGRASSGLSMRTVGPPAYRSALG